MSETPHKKAVIYCRVSSVRQSTEGHGLSSQRSRCEDYCRNKGYEVMAVFTDDVSGGGDFMKRLGMVRLLNFLDDHPEESFVVVFDDLKRYARDTSFHLKLSEEMSLRNATRECLNFKFEDTPEGLFVETVIAAQGQLERQQHSRQVCQKMIARLTNGYYCLQKPIGYIAKDVEGHGSMPVRNEPLASVIAEGIEGFASGKFKTQSELMRFFETFPFFPRNTRGKIHIQRVKEILSNRMIYAGYVDVPSWGISMVKGKHEPLVSLATYQKAQKRLNDTAKAPARKDLNIEFPLRGAVVCGDCGSPFTSCMSKSRNGSHHPYYLCHHKGCKSYGKSIRRAVLEGEFESLLEEIQPSQEIVVTAKKMFRMAWDYRQKSSTVTAEAAKKELIKIDKAIEQLLDIIVNASSPTVIPSYEKRIDTMEKQKLVLKEKLEQKALPIRSFEETFRTALAILSNPLKIWHYGQFEHKRMLLRVSFTDKLTYVRNEGFRTAQKALPFSLLGDISASRYEMVDIDVATSNKFFSILERWEAALKGTDMSTSAGGFSMD